MDKPTKSVAPKVVAPIDLTPFGSTNWRLDGEPVAIVNPAATLHQRLSLDWSMSQELETVADLAVEALDKKQSVCDLLKEKSALLTELLYELAASTAGHEAGGCEA